MACKKTHLHVKAHVGEQFSIELGSQTVHANMVLMEQWILRQIISDGWTVS